MNKLHDPELELFKHAVDLADYAKRAGYALRPEDGAPGLTVLDHPNRDRIVVGQHPNGLWVYASVPDYMLRAPGEPAEQALARLRSAIDRSPDKGTIVEFVQQRDPLGRRGDVPLDQVRAYQIRSRRRRRLFVFRTLEVDDAFAVAVPGVRPRVQLLLELRTAGRIRLARSLFAYLVRAGRDPSALPDIFYTRVGAMLGGRLPAHKVLLHLLRTTREPPIAQPANRTGRPGLEGAER